MSEINTNVVVLSGRMTTNPVVKMAEVNPDEIKMKVEFTLAVNGYKDRVDFLRINAWGNLAENVSEYCQKGRKVTITGNLRREQWESEDEQGVTKKNDRTVVVARTVEFGEKPREKEPEDEAEGYPY